MAAPKKPSGKPRKVKNKPRLPLRAAGSSTPKPLRKPPKARRSKKFNPAEEAAKEKFFGPRRARAQVERDQDVTYGIAILARMGAGTSIRVIAKLVNQRRYRRVLQEELDAGTPREEAELIAKASERSIDSLRGDLRGGIEAVRNESRVSAAFLIQGQLEAIGEEIQATYDLDDRIAAELERSRKVQWQRRTRSLVGEQGASGPSQVAQHETVYSSEVAARAELFARLQKGFELRAKLRDEQRRLVVATDLLEMQAAQQPMPEDLLAQLRDPAKRQEAAMALYARELELDSSAPMVTILPPELRSIATLQAQARARRAAMLRDVFRYSPTADEEPGRLNLTMVYMESSDDPELPPGGFGDGDDVIEIRANNR